MKFLSRKLLAFTLVATMLTGCNNSDVTNNSATSAVGTTATQQTVSDVKVEKMKIITTTFAEYDWVREILGDNLANVDLTLLLDNGLDLHSYNPSVDDIINIGNADLFIYNGGESTDTWTDSAISQAKNSNLISMNLLEGMGELVQTAVHISHDGEDDCCEEEHDHDHDEECTDEDCEHDHDHDHDEECTDEDCEHDHSHDDEHDHDEEECVDECCLDEEHDHDHEEEHVHDEECTDEDCDHDHDHEEEHVHDEDCEDEYCEDESHDHSHSHDDEHFWMSLNNAKMLCTSIAENIIAIDPSNADTYTANLNAYIEKLSNLDQQYKDMVSSAERNVILVADRFPFIYLTSDYGIEYHAAFSGCTAETEASFETIMYLTEKVNELELDYLVTTETGHQISKTIVDNSNAKNQEIFVLDSIQSTSSSSSDTYLSIMEDNLEVLTKVLN